MDETGNRLLKTHDVDGNGSIEESTKYVYASMGTGIGSDRLEREQVFSGTNTNDNTGTELRRSTYTYNPDGSTATITQSGGDTTAYTHDLRGRVVHSDVTKSSVTTKYDFEYDANGRRAKQITKNSSNVVQSVTTKLVDGSNPTGYSQVLEERSASSDSGIASASPTAYVLGLDVIAQATASGIVNFVYDGHGSVRGMVDGGKRPAKHIYEVSGAVVNMAA